MGDQKSNFLDQIKENNRKKIGSKSENRQLSDEKDKLVENFNLIELDEKVNTDEQANKEEEESSMENDAANKRDLRHVQNENEQVDNQVYDAATDEQQKSKQTDKKENEQFDKQTSPTADNVDEQQQLEENTECKNIPQNIDTLKPLDSVNIKQEAKPKSHEQSKEDVDKHEAELDDVEMKPDTREAESFYACSKEKLLSYGTTREEVEVNLKNFREFILNQKDEEFVENSLESLRLWQDYESLTQQMSKELCEQLRLILEPTVCSKLKGDYKSGKRLNMKRVIEYIATEYRKDKIWLRRIKPNKRDYQVMLAIDNSSSMGDNHCIQLAYETIATLTNAFNYLEVGQFGLLKFGENVTQLHDLQASFNSDDGARVLSRIDFKDATTKIAQVICF